MANTKLICLLVLVIVVLAYLYLSNQKEGYVVQELPTSPEVEFIQGQPDFHVVNEVDGTEMIRSGDIALNPGFGIGEGTVGFGRFGLSFMA